MGKYILGIDQSTQGTKALLFDEFGDIVKRSDLPHRQIITEEGYVSHDAMEIYENTILVVQKVVKESGIRKEEILGVGISNQRETSVVWEKTTGIPINHAVVWQCHRAEKICKRVEELGKAEWIKGRTGLQLSPYFPASKFAWLIEHSQDAKEKAWNNELRFGTMDTWLIYGLTKGQSYKTDYSNASRTQLFNIMDLSWDEEICSLFGLKKEWMAEVVDSNALFGMTDFEGFFDHPIPIHGVLGDSHGALFGQGCLQPGMIKTTYGTGSSIMMNIGKKPVLSNHGVVTSLAWGIDGQVNYVLEGNINYTGAIISWFKDDLQIIHNPNETEDLARWANRDDGVYFIPAFTGLGAPYWDSKATASIVGMTRTTTKKEIVRAGLEAIVYQIADVIGAMKEDAGLQIKEVRVDGGPTKNKYLMQFQSDILEIPVQVPSAEELSGMGAAYAAGLALHIYEEEIFKRKKYKDYQPKMESHLAKKKYKGWKIAVNGVLSETHLL
ncbi:MAG TPA: glycerol kinase GlpK [Candidatus Merdenecus merdavium]|nr:glycerol kinase GlpK [Candidatus Merdenecus merdavium]